MPESKGVIQVLEDHLSVAVRVGNGKQVEAVHAAEELAHGRAADRGKDNVLQLYPIHVGLHYAELTLQKIEEDMVLVDIRGSEVAQVGVVEEAEEGQDVEGQHLRQLVQQRAELLALAVGLDEVHDRCVFFVLLVFVHFLVRLEQELVNHGKHLLLLLHRTLEELEGRLGGLRLVVLELNEESVDFRRGHGRKGRQLVGTLELPGKAELPVSVHPRQLLNDCVLVTAEHVQFEQQLLGGEEGCEH